MQLLYVSMYAYTYEEIESELRLSFETLKVSISENYSIKIFRDGFMKQLSVPATACNSTSHSLSIKMKEDAEKRDARERRKNRSLWLCKITFKCSHFLPRHVIPRSTAYALQLHSAVGSAYQYRTNSSLVASTSDNAHSLSDLVPVALGRVIKTGKMDHVCADNFNRRFLICHVARFLYV